MYISEISPAKIRGRMTALFQFNVIFGILIAYVSNYLLRETGNEPWRFMLGVETIPALAFFFLLFLVPRSPRFMIKANKMEEAKKVLNLIEGNNVEAEIIEIQRGFKPVSYTHLCARG